MRNLKFRAFRKTDRIMFNNLIGIVNHNNDFISLYLKNSVTGKELEEYYARADEFEIMQFTGIEDSKGREIYEGDIIPNHFEMSAVGVVTYGQHNKNIGFYINWKNGMHKDLLLRDLAHWASVSEVIGNIYENPELCRELGRVV